MNRVNYKIGNNTISCLEVGKKENPIVLFLHGIPACAEIWRETMEKISSKGYYCIAPDLSGYGLTDINETEYYSLNGNAKLFNCWLKEENFENIWIIAHDLGGAVAQLMITNEPSLFSKVTLSNVGTADTYPIPTISKLVTASKIGFFYLFAILGRFQSERLYLSMKKFFYRNKSFQKTEFERVFYDGKFHKSKSILKFQKMLGHLNNRHTIENMDRLKTIELPIHLIWAMNDKFQSWEVSGKILQDSFKNVRVSKIENCGHYIQIDANDEFVAALLS